MTTSWQVTEAAARNDSTSFYRKTNSVMTTIDSLEQSNSRTPARRVLLTGLGNIGSHVADLVAPHSSMLRLVDRDIVETHNTTNQRYRADQVGMTKTEATADRLAEQFPDANIECRQLDLEDLPWGDIADVDVVLAGLDSLRARQIVSEKTYPLGIPYIDGAVGEPILSRIQVLMPSQACLECSWGPAHYRQVAVEHGCATGAIEAPRTSSPACAGAATASIMVAQLFALFGEQQPTASYEINGDLVQGRFVSGRRRRNDTCRFRHEQLRQRLTFVEPDFEMSAQELTTRLRDYVRSRGIAADKVRLEFRRGMLGADLFGTPSTIDLAALAEYGTTSLESLGLRPRDRIPMRRIDGTTIAHVCFDVAKGATP